MKATTTDAADLTYVRALVYGDSGVGKTTSLKTLSVDGVTIAVCERSVLPLRDKKYKVLHLENWEDAFKLPTAFKNPDGIQDKEIQETIAGTRLLVIDSLSAVAELCWSQILDVDRRALISARTKGKSNQVAGIYAEAAAIEDWGVYGKRMLNWITAINHLPVTVIMTALAAWAKDKQSNETLRLPNLGGQTALKSLALFDEVFLMKSVTKGEDKNIRVWQTFDDGSARAKDSSGVLDEYEEPNWMNVLRKIKGDKGSKK